MSCACGNCGIEEVFSESMWNKVVQSMKRGDSPHQVHQQLVKLSAPNEQYMMGFRSLIAQVPMKKLQLYVPVLVAVFKGGDVMHIMPTLQYSFLEAMLSGGCKNPWFYHRQPKYAIDLKLYGGMTNRWAKRMNPQEQDVDHWIHDRVMVFEPHLNLKLFFYALSFVMCEHCFPEH